MSREINVSFAFTIRCGKAQHRVVIDLQEQKIHLPKHPPELVRRYKALYELGGEPIPCCAVLLDLEQNLYPGYLVIPIECQSKALREWRRRVIQTLPIVIVPGDQEPQIVGRDGFYIGAARGQIIKNVQSFEAKGGRTIYYPTTYRYLIGEATLVCR